MEFQQVLRLRRMVREFTGDPVPHDTVDRILRNAVRGPSAGFCQGQAFLVITGDDLPRFWAVAGEATYPSAQTAPLVIVPLSCRQTYIDRYAQDDPGWADESRWPVPFWHVDTGMAALLILLTAVDEGLGAVFFGIMPDESAALRLMFGVPADHDPVGAIAIGRSAEAKGPNMAARRRDLAEMVHYGRWQGRSAAEASRLPATTSHAANRDDNPHLARQREPVVPAPPGLASRRFAQLVLDSRL